MQLKGINNIQNSEFPFSNSRQAELATKSQLQGPKGDKPKVRKDLDTWLIIFQGLFQLQIRTQVPLPLDFFFSFFPNRREVGFKKRKKNREIKAQKL
mgnify:CR=1 FL=1